MQSGLLQVVVFGRSLGGAVAFHLAATNPGAINSLIVENTFWSIEAVTGKVNMAAANCRLALFGKTLTLLLVCQKQFWHFNQHVVQQDLAT